MKLPDFRSDLQKNAEKQLQSFGYKIGGAVKKQKQNYDNFNTSYAKGKQGTYATYNPLKSY